eukprot:m.48088 g.48088  ORF g.48088 m.48088 type:complete len:64 (-) comp7376_c0_seq2:65-256(-)
MFTSFFSIANRFLLSMKPSCGCVIPFQAKFQIQFNDLLFCSIQIHLQLLNLTKVIEERNMKHQ